MNGSDQTFIVPHPLKAELEHRGFKIARIALRAGMTYSTLVRRLNGHLAMSEDEEARVRAAMDPTEGGTDGQ